MSLNLFLNPGTVPALTALPGNAQALINFISAYTGIAGAEAFSGINFGPNTPSPENQAFPWFKTDSSFNPIGLFAWNGSAWVATPLITPNGPTGTRPISPAVGSQYFDTTINVQLVFERGAWRTLSGSPGDVKFVNTDTIDNALLANPGWVELTALRGRVIGGAGEGTGLTARAVGSVFGEETHRQGVNEMPSHTHEMSVNGSRLKADGNAADAAGIIPGRTASTSDPTGGGEPFNVMQPSIFFFALLKQ